MAQNCNNKPYTITSINDVDIDDLATIPDYFFGMRSIFNEETGNTILTPVRIPGARVMPSGNLANVVAMDTNNPALTVPEGQVRAGYIDVQPGGNIMRLSDNTHRAMFLMLGEYTNGRMLIQSTGFLDIPAGHSYIAGAQYYADASGVPTTDSTVTGQKLFRPLDDHLLLVNGDF